MKTLLRLILSVTLKPFLQHYYLKSARPFRYGSLRLTVEPGVFHPGLFFSSKFFAAFIGQLTLTDQRLLDMGSGSGLLSLVAAQQGATVVSADLNQLAVDNTRANARANKLDIEVIKSDIFDQISGKFDIIIVNPPYYPREAQSDQQLAWYCGDNFQYFRRFFAGLTSHITPQSQVLMVLSEGCALDKISAIAASHQFTMRCVDQRKMLLETNMIYAIELVG
ncbi:MAG: release factor glutamine methyltransferase [Phenylobacterium sp.]|jgi:release factor glutamine methyltransferase